MSMVFLSMLHHFNYPELKYYIYSYFSFYLNLLAVCNCNSLFYIDSSVITQAKTVKSIFFHTMTHLRLCL